MASLKCSNPARQREPGVPHPGLAEVASVLPRGRCHSLCDPESVSATHTFLSMPQFPLCPAELACRGTVKLTSLIPGWPLKPWDGRRC